MDFRFDENECALLADARAILARALPVARLREGGDPVAAWRSLGENDWLHGGLSEDVGGAELALALQAGAAREAGALLAVDEWLNNAFVLPELLARARDADVRAEALAHHRSQAGFLLGDGRGCEWLGGSSGDSARWCFGVADGFDVYRVEGEDGDAVLVRRVGSGLQLARVADLSLGVGVVTVSGGTSTRIALSLDPVDAAVLEQRARTIHAAALVGLADEALRQAVEYAKVRVQYGKPIGQFQALKHLLADVRVANEIAWNAVLYASLTSDDDPRSVPAARMQAVSAALGAVRAMVQVFGGMGFTWESDVHFFLKTALNGSVRFGPVEEDALRLGELVLAGV
jgi:alkylation response protein AidB-like acyl-CoA dehydrogenase